MPEVVTVSTADLLEEASVGEPKDDESLHEADAVLEPSTGSGDVPVSWEGLYLRLREGGAGSTVDMLLAIPLSPLELAVACCCNEHLDETCGVVTCALACVCQSAAWLGDVCSLRRSAGILGSCGGPSKFRASTCFLIGLALSTCTSRGCRALAHGTAGQYVMRGTRRPLAPPRWGGACTCLVCAR